jgi:hypothetical protein
MAVIIEAFSIIIRNSTIEAEFPGALDGYRKACPNTSLCTDGELCRVGFMTEPEISDYLRFLSENGIPVCDKNGRAQIAYVDHDGKILWECDWIQIVEIEGILSAVLTGTEVNKLVAPAGWRPGSSLFKVSTDDIELDYDYLGMEKDVHVFRHKESGKKFYMGIRKQPEVDG